jgi:hypothetical protein
MLNVSYRLKSGPRASSLSPAVAMSPATAKLGEF